MATPAKGDYRGMGLTPDGRKLADAWDPAKDEASGDLCKAYGAPAIMQVPGRFHITWEDERTLRIDTDAGKQTRLLHFGRKRRDGLGESAISKPIRPLSGTPKAAAGPKAAARGDCATREVP